MIGKDSTRLLFTVPKDLKEKLVKQAEEEHRSLSNLVVSILRDRHK
jgi:predicted HicB family RNase H-like nuclease